MKYPIPNAKLFLGVVLGAWKLTHHTVRVVKEEEAQVDLMAGDLASVVQPQQQVVLHQARVHAGHALLQALVELKRRCGLYKIFRYP